MALHGQGHWCSSLQLLSIQPKQVERDTLLCFTTNREANLFAHFCQWNFVSDSNNVFGFTAIPGPFHRAMEEIRAVTLCTTKIRILSSVDMFCPRLQDCMDRVFRTESPLQHTYSARTFFMSEVQEIPRILTLQMNWNGNTSSMDHW